MPARVLRIAAMTAGSCAAALSLHAQEPQEFRAGIDLVPLHVSVTDRDGQLIRDLTREDFEIFDEGRSATIGTFAAPPSSVAIKILIDDRRAMKRHQPGVRRAAAALFSALAPRDRVGVASFRHPGSPFTDDSVLLAAGLDLVLRAPGTTAYDDWLPWVALEIARPGFKAPAHSVGSVLGSIWHVAGGERWAGCTVPEIRRLLLVSSGMDYVSPAILQSHLAAVEAGRARPGDLRDNAAMIEEDIRRTVRDNFIVFGLGFEGTRHEKRLPRLTAESGGWFVEVKRGTDVAGETRRIMDDLHARYLIGFVPAFLEPRDRALKVRVKRPGATVRARAYYQAPLR